MCEHTLAHVCTHTLAHSATWPSQGWQLPLPYLAAWAPWGAHPNPGVFIPFQDWEIWGTALGDEGRGCGVQEWDTGVWEGV